MYYDGQKADALKGVRNPFCERPGLHISVLHAIRGVGRFPIQGAL